MMDTIKRFVREHWLAALTGGVGLIIGALVTDYTSFRTANREALKKQIEASEKADHDMNSILQKFADKALGKSSTSPDDLQALKSTVQDSYAVAERLKDHFPGASREVDEFTDALVHLQKSAESLSGPTNAKDFVESVSKYYITKKNLSKRIVDAQTRWRPI